MSRLGRGVVTLFVGLVLAEIVYTGSFGSFVQQRMKWPLVAAGLVLAALGVIEVLFDEKVHGTTAADSRRRAAPTIGWLLLAPIAVFVAVAPTSLSSAAIDRTDAYAPTDAGQNFEPLADDGLPIPMTLFEFINRANWDDEGSLAGRTIALEGFVVNDERVPGGFLLTRFMVSCCAADGIPLQVAVPGTGRSLPDDTWVQVAVEWSPPVGGDRPEIVEATLLDLVELSGPPEAPYESPY